MWKKKIQKAWNMTRDELLLQNSSYFDKDYYLTTYEDLRDIDINPYRHYLQKGAREGKNPSALFSTYDYLSRYHDVRLTGINPLLHFILYGEKEGRIPGSEQYVEAPHFIKYVDNKAVEVPFSYLTKSRAKISGKIAVICHLFHEDLSAEIVSHLQHIPYSFDCFFTTDTEEKANFIRNYFNKANFSHVEVRVFPNRGRDIAPKFIAWPDVYRDYPYFLHIHSKKSFTHSNSNWRTFLFQRLLGSTEIVISIIDMLEENKDLGIVAPDHFKNIIPFIGWGYNFEYVRQLCMRMDIPISVDYPVDFPSGSMYWGRTAALRPLLDVGLQPDDFPTEACQIDGTIQHAIERLVFYSCEKSGYSWVRVGIRKEGVIEKKLLQVPSKDWLSSKITTIFKPLSFERKAAILQANSHSYRPVEIIRDGRFVGVQLKSEDADAELGEIINFAYYRMLHQYSEMANKAFPLFLENYQKFIAGEESEIDFDETFYLKAFPDVERAIKEGDADSGYAHFLVTKNNEKRIWSNLKGEKKFSIKANLGDGLFAPIAIKSKQPSVVHRVFFKNKTEKKTLILLFSHLEKSVFFAGFKSFFSDFQTVFHLYDEILLFVKTKKFEPELALKYDSRIKVLPWSSLKKIEEMPNLIVVYNSNLFEYARKRFGNTENILYYCQDFESGFFSFGTDYIVGERAIALSKNMVISTQLLFDFIDSKKLINPHSRIFITRPHFEVLPIKHKTENTLFFYFRPEGINNRNLSELIWEAVAEFCTNHTGFQLILAGTVATSFSFERNGNDIFVLSKLPYKDYLELLATCKVVVSMIYSAHPGVVAYQAAASGIPTVTNTFENRDAKVLQSLSKNLVAYDPIRDSLYEKILEAMDKPRGNKHFNKILYTGKQTGTFEDYIKSIDRELTS